MRHLSARTPANNGSSSWFRGYDEAGQRVHYRLFRRSSITRAFSHAAQSFPASTPRSEIARAVNASRRELRARVDAHDLRLMGYTDA